MNIITHNAAYSLYPRATFESRLALVCPSPGINQNKAVEKYSSRGWNMIYELPTHRPSSSLTASLSSPETRDLAASEPAFVSGSRWINDGHSWFFPLHPPLPAPCHVSLYSSDRVSPEPHYLKIMNWQLAYPDAKVPPQFIFEGYVPRMRYCLVKSTLLREVYMLTDELLLTVLLNVLKAVRKAQREVRQLVAVEEMWFQTSVTTATR